MEYTNNCVIFLWKSCTFQKKAVPLQAKMNALFKNSAHLLSANVVAQAIGLIVYPILTRIYSPEDFGLLNLFLSIGGILSVVATIEYQGAIVLPSDDKKSIALFHLGIVTTVVLTVLLLASNLFDNLIGTLFHTPALLLCWKWLAAFVFLGGLWSLQNNWLIRQQEFGAISVYQVSQSVVGSVCKIVFGVIGMVGVGLITSSIIAMAVALILSCCFERKFNRRDILTCHTSWNELKQVAREYKNFPIYSFPRSILNSVSGNLPALVLSPVFGLTELGFFGMAVTLAFRPIQLISQSVYQVLFQRYSVIIRQQEQVLPFTIQMVKKAVLVIVPVFVVLWFVLPTLVCWLLGAEWGTTSYYIRIMLPWLALVVVAPTLGFIPDIFMQQKTATMIEVGYFILRVLALGLGVWCFSFKVAILAYTVVGCIVLGGQIGWYFYLLIQYEKHRNTQSNCNPN
ncbi:MAG: oligosaccharide flippase family protein [Bacteroidales bacterium]|nr:oligosaccharide flippase family protein [Candidatus Colicola equi]